jgi:hypothetical protein
LANTNRGEIAIKCFRDTIGDTLTNTFLAGDEDFDCRIAICFAAVDCGVARAVARGAERIATTPTAGIIVDHSGNIIGTFVGKTGGIPND